jgi:hypothetical protein
MDHSIMAKVFPEMTARKDAGLCPGCGGKITGFKDALSVQEFRITGMCQNCQDKMEAMAEDDEYN